MAFLGIRIPEKIGHLLQKIDVPGKKENIKDYHITLLCFENNCPITKIVDSIESAYKITKNISPFKIKLNKIFNFPKRGDNPVPIIVNVESEDLHNIRNKLAKQFDKDKIDFSKIHKNYNPHVTLSYSDKEIKEFKIDKIELEITELVLWGGDNGEDRLVINFPLSDKNKYSFIYNQIYLFNKYAQTELTEKIAMYTEELDGLYHNLDSSSNIDYKILEFIKEYDNYLSQQSVDIRNIAEGICGYISQFNILDGTTEFDRIMNDIKQFNSGNKILLAMKEIDNADLESSVSEENIKDILKQESLYNKTEIENIFKKILNLSLDEYNIKTIAGYLELFLHSKHINKNLIWRFIRNIDPNYFMQHKKYKIEQKQLYKIDDVLKLISNGLPYSSFQNMIQLSTPQAKNLLRSMIWVAWSSDNKNYIDFMLDETMLPIDIDGKSIKILDNSIIEQAKDITKNIDKWVQQFDDYQVVPFPETFNVESAFKYLIKKYSNNKTPRLIQTINGDKYWYVNNKLHREDGPAIEDIESGNI